MTKREATKVEVGDKLLTARRAKVRPLGHPSMVVERVQLEPDEERSSGDFPVFHVRDLNMQSVRFAITYKLVARSNA